MHNYTAIAEQLQEADYCVIDNALGKDHAEELREEIKGIEKHQATIAHGLTMITDSKRRDDRVAFVKNSTEPALSRHREIMENLRLALEERLQLNMTACSFMAAEYSPNASGYVRHRDASPISPSGRKLTVIYYLNPDWSSSFGGEIILWTPRNLAVNQALDCNSISYNDKQSVREIRIAPLNDRILIFRSLLEHRVLPIGSYPRIALTSWFYNKIELAFELMLEKNRQQQEQE